MENKETTQDNSKKLNEIFNNIKDLDLEAKNSGIICLAFHQKDDEQIQLLGSVQGNHSNLVKLISRAVESDTDLKNILTMGLADGIIARLKVSEDFED